MISKKAKQRIHTKQRAKERYNVQLTCKDIQTIVSKIKTSHKDTTFLKKQSNRVSLWKVIFKDQIFRVVYDKHRKNIVTILPIESSSITIKEVIMDKVTIKNVNDITKLFIAKKISIQQFRTSVNIFLKENTISFRKKV